MIIRSHGVPKRICDLLDENGVRYVDATCPFVKKIHRIVEEKGVSCDLEEIKKDIKERDERDCTRKIAPLRQAEDAVLIDSSDMTIEEVVKAITDNIV